MSEAKSVQFQNMQDVLQAYDNWDIPAFAIWQKKQFLFRYCGEDISVESGKEVLQGWLEMLHNNNTAAIYTLCVYEDLEETEKITSSTPYSGSFNFRLHGHTQGYLPTEIYKQYGGNGHQMFNELQQVRTELKMLQEKLEEKNEDDETEQSPRKRIEGILMDSLEGVLPMVANGLGQKIGDWLNPPAKTATISGITLEDQDAEKWIKINGPLNKLMAADPDFPVVLQKLADLQERKGFQYNMYKAMLLKMKF